MRWPPCGGVSAAGHGKMGCRFSHPTTHGRARGRGRGLPPMFASRENSTTDAFSRDPPLVAPELPPPGLERAFDTRYSGGQLFVCALRLPVTRAQGSASFAYMPWAPGGTGETGWPRWTRECVSVFGADPRISQLPSDGRCHGRPMTIKRPNNPQSESSGRGECLCHIHPGVGFPLTAPPSFRRPFKWTRARSSVCAQESPTSAVSSPFHRRRRSP